MQPDSVGADGYVQATMPKSVKEIVRDNVLALLRRDAPLRPGESGISRLRTKGVAMGTAQRILAGETSVGLDKIEQVAEALGVRPWVLLAENVDLAVAPPADPVAWPFEMVSEDAYRSLTQSERAFVQSKLDSAIGERIAARGSRGDKAKPNAA